ncbi:MAG TPA: hypothetical protein VFN71_06950 [Methylomirabilota bacterium]|nr:hypothetical protein [Methylomirabilota bacterium]
MGSRAARLVSALLGLAALLIGAPGTHAMWAKLTEGELIAQSDLIMTGEVVGLTEVRLAPDQPRLTLAVLRADEVVKSDRSRGYVLLGLGPTDRPRSSTDIFYRVGQRGLWFLRSQPGSEGIYLADHPQRFVPAERADPQLQSLRRGLKRQP